MGEIIPADWVRVSHRGRDGVEGLRCALDGLVFPRRFEEDAFRALQTADPTAHIQGDERPAILSQQGRSTPRTDGRARALAALAEFNARISRSVLDKLHFWPLTRRVLPVLMTLERFPRFEVFWNSHPQLAWLVAQHLYTHDLLTRDSNAAVDFLLSKGPRWMLRWLELPTRRGILKLLRRIPLTELENLRGALPALQNLAVHEPSLQFALSADASFLPEVLAIFSASVTPSLQLLRELESSFLTEQPLPWAAEGNLIRDFHRAAQMDASFALQARSIRRLLAELNSRRPDAPKVERWLSEDASLPVLPFPGTTQIHPITKVRELVLISDRLRNCVRSTFVVPAMQGKVAFWRVVCTREENLLALARQQEKWTLLQFLGRDNSSPSALARVTVSHWLRQHGIPGDPSAATW